VELKAVRPQRRQMRAAGDKMNILTGGGEPRTKIAAPVAMIAIFIGCLP